MTSEELIKLRSACAPDSQCPSPRVAAVMNSVFMYPPWGEEGVHAKRPKAPSRPRALFFILISSRFPQTHRSHSPTAFQTSRETRLLRETAALGDLRYAQTRLQDEALRDVEP